MANSYADWKRQMSELDALISRIGASIILIRKLEGIAELESKLLLNPPRNGELVHELDEIIDGLSSNLFGVTKEDTQFKYPNNFGDLSEGGAEWWSIQSRANEYEEQFTTDYMADDEAVLTFLAMGVDFRNDRGDPLRCTKLLCRQVEGAVTKVLGRLPDVQELELKALESKLENDVRLHLARKGKA
jgi:hypothetical protein